MVPGIGEPVDHHRRPAAMTACAWGLRSAGPGSSARGAACRRAWRGSWPEPTLGAVPVLVGTDLDTVLDQRERPARPCVGAAGRDARAPCRRVRVRARRERRREDDPPATARRCAPTDPRHPVRTTIVRVRPRHSRRRRSRWSVGSAACDARGSTIRRRRSTGWASTATNASCRNLSFGNLRKVLLADAFTEPASALVAVDEVHVGLDHEGRTGLEDLVAGAVHAARRWWSPRRTTTPSTTPIGPWSSAAEAWSMLAQRQMSCSARCGDPRGSSRVAGCGRAPRLPSGEVASGEVRPRPHHALWTLDPPARCSPVSWVVLVVANPGSARQRRQPLLRRAHRYGVVHQRDRQHQRRSPPRSLCAARDRRSGSRRHGTSRGARSW